MSAQEGLVEHNRVFADAARQSLASCKSGSSMDEAFASLYRGIIALTERNISGITSLESELAEAQFGFERELALKQELAAHVVVLRAENARLRADNAELRKVLTRSENGWSNAIELGLIPDQHVMSATILRDEARAALAGHEQAGAKEPEVACCPFCKSTDFGLRSKMLQNGTMVRTNVSVCAECDSEWVDRSMRPASPGKGGGA